MTTQIETDRPRAPAGGCTIDGVAYEGGQFLPEQYDDHRAARSRRRQEAAAQEGYDKARAKWGWVLRGDKVIIHGFLSDRPGVVSAIHPDEVAVRLEDGTRDWWPLWAISANKVDNHSRNA